MADRSANGDDFVEATSPYAERFRYRVKRLDDPRNVGRPHLAVMDDDERHGIHRLLEASGARRWWMGRGRDLALILATGAALAQALAHATGH